MQNHGCICKAKVSENDLYLATDDEIVEGAKPHTRFMAAQEKRKTDERYEILTFDELYKLLGVTEKELLKYQVPIIKERKLNEGTEGTLTSHLQRVKFKLVP